MTRYLTMAALSAAMMLGGCATTGRAGRPATSTPGETVRVAVGPCFGFCPVYSVSVAPDGAVHFVGERHTAVLGARTTRVPAPVPSALVRDLARYRPATGDDVPVACTAAVSDTSAYSVTWTDAAGRKTVARVQDACPGGPGQGLVRLLRALPSRLGIADWTKQVTRPGVSRG